MDSISEALLDVVSDTGFLAWAIEEPGKWTAYAYELATGKTYLARGDDVYEAACELAEAVGFVLEDG